MLDEFMLFMEAQQSLALFVLAFASGLALVDFTLSMVIKAFPHG